MEYTVLLERKAVKQLKDLDQRAKSRVVEALRELERAFPPTLDIKKMKGYKNHYRVRVGDYRILFELRPERTIVVYAILPREKAYKSP